MRTQNKIHCKWTDSPRAMKSDFSSSRCAYVSVILNDQIIIQLDLHHGFRLCSILWDVMICQFLFWCTSETETLSIELRDTRLSRISFLNNQTSDIKFD